jgi:hypothetical protein
MLGPWNRTAVSSRTARGHNIVDLHLLVVTREVRHLGKSTYSARYSASHLIDRHHIWRAVIHDFPEFDVGVVSLSAARHSNRKV